MAFITAQNIGIDSIVCAVPKNTADNLDDPNIETEKAKKIIDSTGIRFRRIANTNQTTSDLCYEAAQHLLSSTKTERADIEILIFISQTPDFVLPATAITLQNRLGFGQNTLAFDVNLGCSGYVYGLSIISSLLEKLTKTNAKALLLVGDTISKLSNPKDLSTYPLFGDGAAATLLSKRKGEQLSFCLQSNGSDWEAIKVDDGGFRNQITQTSETVTTADGNNYRRPRDLFLNGMDVFSFGITKVPRAVKDFYEEANLTKDVIDYYVFHQANQFMNEKIRKKLKLPEYKVPYSLYDYANTSSATIPLTITSQLKDKIGSGVTILSCGFGVGLSWGTCAFDLSENAYLNTIEV